MQSQLTFCESDISTSFELGNTVTSFAYIVIGTLILIKHWKNKDWDFIKLGLASIFVGFGSIALHATKTQQGLIIDFYSMSVLSGIILSEFFLKNKLYFRFGVHIFGAVSLLISIVTLNHFLVQFSFAVFALTALTLGIYKNIEFRNSMYLRGGLILIIIAFIFWIIDTTRMVCKLDSMSLNGHAVWHILTTVVIYLVYRALLESNEIKKS